MTNCTLSSSGGPIACGTLGKMRPVPTAGKSRFASSSSCSTDDCSELPELQPCYSGCSDVGVELRMNEVFFASRSYDEMDDCTSVCRSSVSPYVDEQNEPDNGLEDAGTDMMIGEDVAKSAASELDLQMKSRLPALKLQSGGCDMMPGRRSCRPRAAVDVGTPCGPSKAAHFNGRMTAAWSQL